MALPSTTTAKSLSVFAVPRLWGTVFFGKLKTLIIMELRHKAVLSVRMRKRKAGMRLYSSYYPKKLLLLQGLYLIMSMV